MTVAIDLSSSFGQIRDQGLRPTCLAFAASSVHELARGRTRSLSVEALFSQCKRRDGLAATDGTTVTAAVAALASSGQCEDALWPYGASEPALFPGDYYRARTEERATVGLLDLIKLALRSGRAAVLVVHLTEPWFSVESDGLIQPPDSADQLEGAHAVAAVGYDDAKTTLLIRNSWGTDWAAGGYAQLPYRHVEWYGIEMFTLVALSTP